MFQNLSLEFDLSSSKKKLFSIKSTIELYIRDGSMLVYLRDKFRRNGKTTFSQGELGMLLSLYGAHVQKGEWRDYAIDSLTDMAVFSIFRSSREQPLYSITKIHSRSLIKPSQYAVHSRSKFLKQSASLREIIDFLEEQT